jgi:ubiquinone/menaquinone biosynthesis C-methylase UbiE
MAWSAGRYECIGDQLLSAAAAVVRKAAIQPGERVLDVGCGTGNAALLAAELGGRVTGVDPAVRLLDVARTRAEAESHEISFVEGEAAELPLDDASVDVVLSVFGIIFAPDPAAAATEMARVLHPAGRLVFSAWVPGGAIGHMSSLAAETVQKALGAPTAPKPFPWHQYEDVKTLFAPFGFAVTMEEESLAFTDRSADAFLENEKSNHPIAVAGFGILQPLGLADALLAQMRAILVNGNEDPSAFRVTSRYVVASARR